MSAVTESERILLARIAELEAALSTIKTETHRTDADILSLLEHIYHLADQAVPKEGAEMRRGDRVSKMTETDNDEEPRIKPLCQRTIKACLGAVYAEEELDGPIPEANLNATLAIPEQSLRAAVRATKRGIAERIKALQKTDAS